MKNQWDRAVWVKAAVSAVAALAVCAVIVLLLQAHAKIQVVPMKIVPIVTNLPPPMKETVPAPQPPIVVTPAPVAELPAWKKYAVKAVDANGKPRIVIIIDDMGMDRVHSKEITTLPGPLTLSYMPYPPHIRDEVADGRAAGDEIMMHMPMEPMDASLMSGDYFLTTKMSPEVLKAALDRNLAAFDDFVGMNNHMGSRLTQDRAAMDVVMSDLAARGMLFVDSRTIAGSVAAQAAAAAHLPQISRDVFLDDVAERTAVDKQLTEVERIARTHGLSVAIGHPKAATIAALRAWLPTLAAKGFVLEPVSAVVSENPRDNRKSVSEPVRNNEE